MSLIFLFKSIYKHNTVIHLNANCCKKALDNSKNAEKKDKMSAFDNLVKVIIQITNIKDKKEVDFAWCYTEEMFLRVTGEFLDDDYKQMYINSFKEMIDKTLG